MIVVVVIVLVVVVVVVATGMIPRVRSSLFFQSVNGYMALISDNSLTFQWVHIFL